MVGPTFLHLMGLSSTLVWDTMGFLSGHQLLHLCNGSARVQTLRADFSAVHDSVASVQRPFVSQLVQTLSLEVVTRVHDPPVSLHDNGGPEVFVTVPPIAGAGSTAASAQNALVHAVE